MSSYKSMIPPTKGSRWSWIHFRHYTRSHALEIQGQKCTLLDHAVQIITWFGKMVSVVGNGPGKKPQAQMSSILHMFAAAGGGGGSDNDDDDDDDDDDEDDEESEEQDELGQDEDSDY